MPSKVTDLNNRQRLRHMIGYSVTLWYGTDHFKICHHLEGMHALIRYPRQ